MKSNALGLMVAACALSAPLPAHAAAAAAEVPLLVAEQIDTSGRRMPSSPLVVELVKQLAEETGIKLVLSPYPWRRAQVMAENGEGLLFGAAVTPERARSLNFTRPLYAVNQWLVSSADRPLAFRRWEDLRGKVISISSGAHYGAEFEQYRGKLFTVEENAASNVGRLKMVTAGHVDAALAESVGSPEQLGAYMNCFYKDAGRWVVAEKPVGAEPALIAVPKTPPFASLLPTLNNAIEQLIKSGRMQKMLDQHTANSGC